MNLRPLEIKLSKSSSLIQSNGLRKSIRETPALIKIMFKLIIRRQRYMMQLLKYFVMFPGQSNLSEDMSIDSYDRLFFSDDAIHSMVKIYEVKQLQNMIWAFLNIKALKYLECCRKLQRTVTKVYQKRIPAIKNQAFQTIKQYDLYIRTQNPKKSLKTIDLSNYKDQQINTFHKKLKIQSKTNNVLVESIYDFNHSQGIQSRIDINLSNNGQKKQKQKNLGDSLNKLKKIDNKQEEENKQQQRKNNKILTKVVFTYSNILNESQKKLSRISSNSNLYRYSVPKSQNQTNTCTKCFSCCSCGNVD